MFGHNAYGCFSGYTYRGRAAVGTAAQLQRGCSEGASQHSVGAVAVHAFGIATPDREASISKWAILNSDRDQVDYPHTTHNTQTNTALHGHAVATHIVALNQDTNTPHGPLQWIWTSSQLSAPLDLPRESFSIECPQSKVTFCILYCFRVGKFSP